MAVLTLNFCKRPIMTWNRTIFRSTSRASPIAETRCFSILQEGRYSRFPSARSMTAQSYRRMNRGLNVVSLSLVTSSRKDPMAESSIPLVTYQSSA